MNAPKPLRQAAPAGERLRVACVSVSAALGGSEWSLLDFAVRASGHGIEPVVVLPASGPLATQLESAGVPTVVAMAPPALLATSQRRTPTAADVAAAVRGTRAWAAAIRDTAQGAFGGPPAVLYSNGFKAHAACALLRGPAHVWHLREFPPAWTGTVWRLLAQAIPDATIANSHATAAAWAAWGGPRPTVVHNGVDLDRFVPAERSGWIHDLIGVPRDVRLIGMPAAFARWKGHLEVVAAFEQVAMRLPDAHLVLVGGPIYDTDAERGYGEELVRRVRTSSGSARRPLDDRIHFVRFQPAPWTLYPEFDLVVHFSLRPEPFGRVVAEAMACGTPVLAASAGGPRELIEHGVSGWLTEPGDTRSLGEAMVTALASDVTELRSAARRQAERRCDARRYAEEVAAVLRHATGMPLG